MTRLSWGSIGKRYFEAGVDRGVLYVGTNPGVPWNGLKAVNEAPSGGEPKPYYIDGFKYLNVASAEEYAATLEAFSAPPEFGVCDGTVELQKGLFATEQPRKQFHLSYRTRIGNDIEGADHGSKIHLVYNALAKPSSRNNQTNGGSVSPLGLSWAITTNPPKATGFKPTAHFVIDSRLTPPDLWAAIEDILYGTLDLDARMPTVAEIIELFDDYVEPVPPVPFASTFKQSALNSNNQTTYTFVDQPIGEASATRRVVVGISGSSSKTVSSVTIGGVAATIDATHVLSGTARLAIASAVVPLGTVATVVVTFNGTSSACGLGVWTLNNAGAPTGQVATGSGDPTNLTITTLPGDVVIAIAHTYNSVSATFDWTNATARFDIDTDNTTETTAGADALAVSTSVAISLNASLATTVGLAAAYR